MFMPNYGKSQETIVKWISIFKLNIGGASEAETRIEKVQYSSS